MSNLVIKNCYNWNNSLITRVIARCSRKWFYVSFYKVDSSNGASVIYSILSTIKLPGLQDKHLYKMQKTCNKNSVELGHNLSTTSIEWNLLQIGTPNLEVFQVCSDFFCLQRWLEEIVVNQALLWYCIQQGCHRSEKSQEKVKNFFQVRKKYGKSNIDQEN